MVALKLLILTAALTAAHPHPHRHGHAGECKAMRSSTRGGGRARFISHPFKCMKGIKLPEEELQAIKSCRSKAHFFMYNHFSGDKIDNWKTKNLEELKASKEEFFAKCMVESLELEAPDGSLDERKIIKNTLDIDSSDISALMKMQTMLTICAKNSTGDNATEQFLSMWGCVHRMLKSHCALHHSLVEKYLQRGSDVSVCANVTTSREDSMMEEHFKTCMAEQAVHAATQTQDGRSATLDSSKGRFAKTMVGSTMCVAKKMDWLSDEAGFDLASYKDFVANFTGWEDVPQALEEVLKEMESCEPEFTGDIYHQLHHWKSCFVTKIVDICGFNNNVTKFFFPFINVDIQKAALKFIEKMKDARDDDIIEDLSDADIDYKDDEYDDYNEEDYRDYEGEEYHEDDYDGDHVDVDDDDDDENAAAGKESEAVMVDDGLIEMDSIVTANEADEDAYLMGGDADNDADDDDINVNKGTKESLEDDAEDILSPLKKRKVASSESRDSGKEPKSSTSTNTGEEKQKEESQSTQEVSTIAEAVEGKDEVATGATTEESGSL